jgi:hypothetical protein
VIVWESCCCALVPPTAMRCELRTSLTASSSLRAGETEGAGQRKEEPTREATSNGPTNRDIGTHQLNNRAPGVAKLLEGTVNSHQRNLDDCEVTVCEIGVSRLGSSSTKHS